MKRKDRSLGDIFLYLLLIVLLSAFCFVTLNVWLQPYSVAYGQTGEMTAGYLLYAAIGILFSTPAPFIAALILYLIRDGRGVKRLFADIFRTEKPLKTALVTGGFCGLALAYALLFGQPNGSPWYLFPLGFLIMIPFVGIAEETGWRGFLQSELDRRVPFPFSTLSVAAVWYVWHLPNWLDPTSRHFGDSLIGFGITILIWAFALTAIYKSTRSVVACAVYHAFVDAIGAVFDWNALFDAFPGTLSTNVFRSIWLACALVLWLVEEKRKGGGRGEAGSELPRGDESARNGVI